MKELARGTKKKTMFRRSTKISLHRENRGYSKEENLAHYTLYTIEQEDSKGVYKYAILDHGQPRFNSMHHKWSPEHS